MRKTTELCIDVSRYTGMNLVNLYTIFLKRKHMNVHRSTQIYLNIYMYIYMYICDEISTNIEINMFCFLLVVTWTSKIVFLGSQRFFFSSSRFEEVLPLPERHAWKDQGAMACVETVETVLFFPLVFVRCKRQWEG